MTYISDNDTEVDPAVVEDFAKITDFYAIQDEKKIMYPYMKDPSLVYEWFVANHNPGGNMLNNRNQMVIKEYMQPLRAELKKT